MRILILAALAATPAVAQHTLYACAAMTKEYVVGAKYAPSGLFERRDGHWTHEGFPLPFLFGVEADPSRPRVLYLAAGNGLIRTTSGGENWTILTGSDVTELRDIAVSDRELVFAHSAGIRASTDGGKTWRELAGALHRKYTECVRIDPKHANVLVAGGEDGVFRSDDAGQTWTLAGAAGYQILRLEVSPHDACFWLAATQMGGLFASHDCAKTFESSGRTGVGSNLYDIAFDPLQRGRIAVAGWGPGVLVSEDGGRSWTSRNAGLAATSVTTVAFDPGHAGRLYAAVHEDAVYVSDDAGLTWKKDGLDGSHVMRLRFFREDGR
jgi:photosystem II stability/assembly factor-like uncharacterized protein